MLTVEKEITKSRPGAVIGGN